MRLISDISKSKSMTSLLAILAALAVPALLTGCNTTSGFGDDLEAVGDEIEDTADDMN